MRATRPVALTCGDPAGIGAEIALAARAHVGSQVPFFWIGDPAHLPGGTFRIIGAAQETPSVPADLLPVLAHPFPHPAVPGKPALAMANNRAKAAKRGMVLTTPP